MCTRVRGACVCALPSLLTAGLLAIPTGTGTKEEGGGCGCQTPSRASEEPAAGAAAADAPPAAAPGKEAAVGITDDMVLIEGAS